MCRRIRCVEFRSRHMHTQKSTGTSAMVQCIRLHTNNCRTRAGESRAYSCSRTRWVGVVWRIACNVCGSKLQIPRILACASGTLTTVSTSIQVSWLHNTPAPSSTPQVSRIRVPSLKNACQTPSSMLPTTNASISNYVTILTRWGSSTYAPWKLGRPPRRPL